MNNSQSSIVSCKTKQKTEKEKQRDAFLKTVESKLKKNEKDIWYIHDIEHVFDKNQ